MKRNNQSSGFTITEVMVTVVIATLFMTLFLQSYIAIGSQRQAIERRTYASNIAHTNLRKFAERPSSLTTCDSSSMNGLYSAQLGLLLGDQSNTATPSNPSGYGFTAERLSNLLGPAATQEVRVIAPYGCSVDMFSTMPLKIISTVRYGNTVPQEEVVHVSYVK